MKENSIAETSVTIHAPREKVWKTLTTPESIEKFLMGTHVHTDWKEGGAIRFEGSYQGKSYQDKGTIKQCRKPDILQFTYWSSMGGKEDRPENYNLVGYHLSDKEGATLLRLTQDNIHSEKEKEHALDTWKTVLQKIKEITEQ